MSRSDAPLLSARVPSTQSLLSDGVNRPFTISFNRERTVLIGRNGIGKTRFVRALLGLEEKSGIQTSSSGSVGYLAQEVPLCEDPTIADVFDLTQKLQTIKQIEGGHGILEEIEGVEDVWAEITKAEIALSRLGLPDISWERPLHTLSGGQRTRVDLARLLFVEPSFLILDEPTNHLDIHAREYVYEFLRQWNNGALIVSHDRRILSMADRIIEMTELGFQVYSGSYDDFVTQKDIERAAARSKFEEAGRQRKTANRVEQRSKEKAQQRDAKGRADRKRRDAPKSYFDSQKARAEKTKSKDATKFVRKIEQANTKHARAAKAVERDVHLSLTLPKVVVRERQKILSVTGLQFSFLDGQPTTIQDLTFELVGARKIALTGANGSGKTTLLRLLDGSLNPHHGSIEVHVDHWAYLDQHTKVLDPALSVQENFTAINPDLPVNRCHSVLAMFMFKGAESTKPVRWLSGGERMRAALACLLGGQHPPQLLLLDEPTNHLDLDGLAAVTTALRNHGGAMIVTSHDETFLAELDLDLRWEMSELGELMQ